MQYELDLKTPLLNAYGTKMIFQTKKPNEKGDDVETYEKNYMLGDLILSALRQQNPKSVNGNTEYLTPGEMEIRYVLLERMTSVGSLEPLEYVSLSRKELKVIKLCLAHFTEIVSGGQALHYISLQINPQESWLTRLLNTMGI